MWSPLRVMTVQECHEIDQRQSVSVKGLERLMDVG